MLVPLLLLLEMCACLLKRWAKLRRMPTVSRTLVDGALIDKRMMPEKKLGRGGSFLEQAVSAMTPEADAAQPRPQPSRVAREASALERDGRRAPQLLPGAHRGGGASAMPRDEVHALGDGDARDAPPRRDRRTRSSRHPAVVEPFITRAASRRRPRLATSCRRPPSAASPSSASRSARSTSTSARRACSSASSPTRRSGQLVALMGESGSGKSTLLNVLGGRSGYGEISVASKGAKDEPHSLASLSDTDPIKHPMLLNSAPFEPRRLKALVGFVPQAHIIFKDLTVYENLVYASQMRAESTMTVDTRMRLVEMSLDLLGLQECRHFVCDPSLGERLSGGQLRRIGIGIELVCDPPIMLLDGGPRPSMRSTRGSSSPRSRTSQSAASS